MIMTHVITFFIHAITYLTHLITCLTEAIINCMRHVTFSVTCNNLYATCNNVIYQVHYDAVKAMMTLDCTPGTSSPCTVNYSGLYAGGMCQYCCLTALCNHGKTEAWITFDCTKMKSSAMTIHPLIYPAAIAIAYIFIVVNQFN